VGSAKWETDPFAGVVDGGRLYGLGACDMKGALAAMIEAATSIDDLGSGRLSLLFTADEENAAEYGARWLAESQAIDADAVVIGEPGGMEADWDHLHLLSRGLANFTVKVRGDQGHSSLSDRRNMVNASLHMAELLLSCAVDFHPTAPPHRLVPSGPTVNPGVKVAGGVNFGVYPGSAEFSVDVRTLPGMDRAGFETELEAWLEDNRQRIPGLRAEIHFEEEPRGWLPATEVSDDAAITKATAACLEDVFGKTPPISAFPGATDAAWLHGLAGIPTLPAVGPGLLEQAHKANEFVSLDALRAAPSVFAGIAARYCPEGKGPE
jgi:acetylornithine deacetylase/succinyl-diaminopimelate desuccinylase-like protein